MTDTYKQSEILQKIDDLLEMIVDKFSYFNQLYLDNYKELISEDEMIKKIKEKIETFSDIEWEEYNEMTTMLSKTNCCWSLYRTGELVHKLLMEQKYPDMKSELNFE